MNARGIMNARGARGIMNAAHYQNMATRMDANRQTTNNLENLPKLDAPSGQVESSKEINSAVPVNKVQVDEKKSNDFGDKAVPAQFDPISVSAKPSTSTFVRGRVRGVSSRVENQSSSGAQITTEAAHNLPQQALPRPQIGRGRGAHEGEHRKSEPEKDNSFAEQSSRGNRGVSGRAGFGNSFGRGSMRGGFGRDQGSSSNNIEDFKEKVNMETNGNSEKVQDDQNKGFSSRGSFGRGRVAFTGGNNAHDSSRGSDRGVHGSRGSFVNSNIGRDIMAEGNAAIRTSNSETQPTEQRKVGNAQNRNDTDRGGMRGGRDNTDQTAESTYDSYEYYIPPIRPIEELIKEDIEQSECYATIADEDEEVKFSGLKTQEIVALDTWKDANFEEVLYKNIVENSKYVRPRNIQALIIPLILEGRDVKGHAETGSGKTAAFMLPIIDVLLKTKKRESTLFKPAPYAIIIEPTRELCIQVYEQGRKWTKGTDIIVERAYGKFNASENRKELQAGCDILCVTIGRLKHLVFDEWIRLENIKFLVMDEADRLMDYKFAAEPKEEKDKTFLDIIREVLSREGFPKKENRQNLLFSATFPEEVMKLSEEMLKEDSVAVSRTKLVSPSNKIIQEFQSVDSTKKKFDLLKLLKKAVEDAKEANVPVPRYLVFVAKKKTADFLSIYLSAEDVKSQSINGDRKQALREVAFDEFRKGDVIALISTDVCARGIDIKNLDFVINYDLPNFKGTNPADPTDTKYDERPITYVHRIGRTGRIRPGKAISFFDDREDNDRTLAAKLIEFVREADQTPPDFLVQCAEDVARIDSFVPADDPWAIDHEERAKAAAKALIPDQATIDANPGWD